MDKVQKPCNPKFIVLFAPEAAGSMCLQNLSQFLQYCIMLFAEDGIVYFYVHFVLVVVNYSVLMRTH